MSTTEITRTFIIGAAVTVPSDFCVGCMSRMGPTSGLIVGYVDDGDQHHLFGDNPGPFYTVNIDHEHNAGGSLVYAENELATGQSAKEKEDVSA
jgi:hypothetical protein